MERPGPESLVATNAGTLDNNAAKAERLLGGINPTSSKTEALVQGGHTQANPRHTL